jgi:effector-binding domain-containing protein
MKKCFFLTVLSIILLFTSSASAQESVSVQIKNVGEQIVLLLKGTSSKQTIDTDMDVMFKKVYDYMVGAGIKPSGPPLSLYYTEPGPQWKIAVAVPVAKETKTPKANEAVQLVTLTGGKMASVMHTGPYEKLGDAWTKFSKWVQSNGYSPAFPAREIYRIGPEKQPNPAKYQTQLLWPVH